MLLSNLISIPTGQGVDILIKGETIQSVSESIKDSVETKIEFKGALVFPGLINSHEHLDFNLFPKLGNRIYNNYVEWGDDIHEQNKEVIDKVLKVPLKLRITWGMYKNLLNGVTTVVNHGPQLPIGEGFITVLQEKFPYALHSIQLDKKWRYKLNFPFLAKHPFVIHIGEGADDMAKKEIDTLLKWNLLKRELIGIHAIALNEKQAAKFKAIIWCPDSNYFLVGQTAPINKLKKSTQILFGTDSNVSSSWNLWEHLRLAREQKMVTDEELFNMLTVAAAKVWQLPHAGIIEKGYNADIIVGRHKAGLQGMNAWYNLNPEDILLVMHKGGICLFDEELHTQLSKQIELKNFCKVFISGNCKYVLGDIPRLMAQIREYYPEASFPITDN